MTYYNVDSQPSAGQYGQQFYNNNQSTASMMSIPDYNDKYTTGAYGSGYTGGDYTRSIPWYKSKWFKIGAGLLVLTGIGGGIAAYYLTKDDSPSRPSSSRTVTAVKNDPNLHVSFPGMCYSPPYSSFYPNCGDTIEGVEVDMQLIAQLTKVVRLYGADCNTSALVLDAIQRTGVDLSVFLGIYISEDSSVFDRQLEVVLDALKTFGTDNVQGIISGNEYILGQSTANGAAGVTEATALVISNMAEVRSQVEALKLPKTIPVGFADAGSLITTELARGADFVMANVHPFFSGVGIDLAAGWTWNYLETDAPATAKLAANSPPVYAAEVGWPGGAFANGSLTLNGSEASMDNMQVFLDSYACQANTNSTPYFWFESTQFGGAESFWGLFNSDRTLKDNIKIPDCEPATFD